MVVVVVAAGLVLHWGRAVVQVKLRLVEVRLVEPNRQQLAVGEIVQCFEVQEWLDSSPVHLQLPGWV